MKEYTATFEMNNGYTCTCCRETWTIEREAEFEDGTPYSEVLEYFERQEDGELALLFIKRINVSPGDIDELQDEIVELKKNVESSTASLVKAEAQVDKLKAAMELIFSMDHKNAATNCFAARAVDIASRVLVALTK